jgi:hypothetical protein
MSGRPLTIALGIAIVTMLALTVLPARQGDAASAQENGAKGLSMLDFSSLKRVASGFSRTEGEETRSVRLQPDRGRRNAVASGFSRTGGEPARRP